MDAKKILSGTAHGVGAVVRSLTGAGGGEDLQSKQQVLDLLQQQAEAESKKFTPTGPNGQFTLPTLDESLSEEGQARKAETEAKGETFVPTEDDYKDAGPYGYLHKKAIHDALQEYAREIESNTPKIDYSGILKQRLADFAAMPAEHHTNPLMLFAMAMGNPKAAQELIATHNKAENDANTAQTQRWQDLLGMKQQALEGSIKQALAEGEHRKVISSKWLEALAQIEMDKAKLGGTMQQLTEKNASAERRAELRGQWALAAVRARASAMLDATGIRSDSAKGRATLDSATRMINTLIRKGVEPEDAHDTVMEWLHNEIDGTTGPVSPSGMGTPHSGAGGAASTAPQGAANPLEAQINANRKKAAPAQ